MKRIRIGINEVAEATGLNKQTIRRLSNDGIIPCIRDSNGYRLFNPGVVEWLRRHYIKVPMTLEEMSPLARELRKHQMKIEKLLAKQLAVEAKAKLATLNADNKLIDEVVSQTPPPATVVENAENRNGNVEETITEDA